MPLDPYYLSKLNHTGLDSVLCWRRIDCPLFPELSCLQMSLLFFIHHIDRFWLINCLNAFYNVVDRNSSTYGISVRKKCIFSSLYLMPNFCVFVNAFFIVTFHFFLYDFLAELKIFFLCCCHEEWTCFSCAVQYWYERFYYSAGTCFCHYFFFFFV